MSKRNLPHWLNPPPHRLLTEDDEEFLDAISTAYNQSVTDGDIQRDVIVIPEVEPSLDGFKDYVTNDVADAISDGYKKTKEFVGKELDDLVDWIADAGGKLEKELLPSPPAVIGGLGITAFFAALGLIVAAKHL